jgi:hypothetical protein
MVVRSEDPSGSAIRPPKAANDNGFEVLEDWPEILPVTEVELRLHETHFADIIAELVAANDNEPQS